MKTCYCTPVPSKRVSVNAKIEFRVSAQDAKLLAVKAVMPDGTAKDCGRFAIENGMALNKVYPQTSGLLGPFTFVLTFLLPDGTVADEQKFSYEIVTSDVHSTCLLDGCWISIRHWSPTESRCFRKGLSEMTDEGWKDHIYGMHKVGITTVLIQNLFDSDAYVHQHDMTADTYRGTAFYDTPLAKRYPGMQEKDPFEAILTAADECDMAVFAGVGLYAWFDFSPESLKWHKRVAKELFERYGHHPSFYGFYISEEIFGALYFEYDPVPNEKYLDIQNFFREFRAFAHELAPTKPVALAPNNIHMDQYREQWKGVLENLDIMIPFAFARSENNIKEIQEMCKESDVHFWVDMEMFRFPFEEGALVPKTYEELLKEIHDYDMLEQIYGYQYTGLMNEPGKGKDMGGERTEELYVKYLDYEKKIRKIQ